MTTCVDEFAFEITLCAQLEATGQLVGRQLGTGVINPGHRIADIITVTPTSKFDVRKQITHNEIPDTAIEANVGPGRYRYWKNAYRPLDIHPEHARESMEQAVTIGFFETTRRAGRTYIRQVSRYPSWIDSIRAIENKPDLGQPGDLKTQLRNDVTLGVVDEVILATNTHVTGAHLNRIPDEVGVWEFSNNEITVVREPTRLPVSAAGIERLEQHPGRTDIHTVTPDQKSRARRRLGERVYGKGWRTFELSDCKSLKIKPHERSSTNEEQPSTADVIDGIPFCSHYNRIINPRRACGLNCPHYHQTNSPLEVPFDTFRETTSPWTQTPPLTTKQTNLNAFHSTSNPPD